MNKRLVVHIGLPKTATTTLQMHFFPQLGGYLGKGYPSPDEGSAWGPSEVFSEFSDIQNAYYRGQDWEARLADWVHKLDFKEHPVQLISDEVLARWTSPLNAGGSSWPVEPPRRGEVPRRGAPPVAVLLAKLRDFLPPDVSLFTIVTLRNQADFLGSHAGQSGVRVRGGGAVFERVIQREDAYMDFYSLVTELEKVSGPSQHLTLLFEDGVEQNCKNIVEFADLTPLKEVFNFEFGKRANLRRTDDNTWRRKYSRPSYHTSGVFLGLRKVILGKFPRLFPAMRAVNRFVFARIGAVRRLVDRAANGQTVSISDENRRKLRVYCAPSNQRLAEHLKRDLAFLGY
jgi:hypothetical protein